MAERHRLNLALYMDNALQREAWNIINSSENKTAAICEAVCGYHGQKKLLEEIRKIIREELRNSSSPYPATSISTPALRATDKEDDAILSFIKALQDE